MSEDEDIIDESSDAEESSEDDNPIQIPGKTTDRGLISYLIGGALLGLTAGTLIWFNNKND